MTSRRAVVVDRESLVLARLAAELGRAGYAVETLATTVGLTPDLLALSAPEFLVLDAGLPGLDAAALLVVVRSMKARLPVRVIVTTDGNVASAERLGADLVVPRQVLLSEGVRAFGLAPEAGGHVDIRAVIDEVLGTATAQSSCDLEVRVDLFSSHNFFVGRDGQPRGVFVATPVPPPVGQTAQLKLDLLGRDHIETSGEVVWQRTRAAVSRRLPAGVGVKFLALTPDQSEAVRRFLELREPLTWTG